MTSFKYKEFLESSKNMGENDMRRKVLMPMLLGMVLMLVAGVLAGAGTLAIFTDTETSHGNVAIAGVLDLKVKGSSWDDDPNIVHMSVDNMKPGEMRLLGIFKLKNAGTVPGKLTLKIKNPVSHENGLEEPEIAAGDQPGVEIDPTGYDANEGDGELWDQCAMKIFVDENKDGVFQWYEPVIYDGPMGLDMTSYYSIPLDTNLFPATQGFNETLNPGEVIWIGIFIKFFDDQGSPMTSQPQYNGLTNNMAMGDSIEFDIEFGLIQS